MNKRAFLKTAAYSSLALIPLPFINILWEKPVFNKQEDPPLPLDKDVLLHAQNAKISMYADAPETNIWSFAKDSFALPIIMKQGESMKIVAKNSVDDTLGVHWHGIRLPNNMDGVPNLTQKPILNNESFTYEFSSPDAGTYWYHTHSNTVEQISRGLVGPLIVKEAKEYEADYDKIILVNDWLLSDNMQIIDDFNSMRNMSHGGRVGNLLTVNGKHNPIYRFKANARIRLRIINASSGRYIAPSFASLDATFIAIDGHPVPPKPYKPLLLAPGMRLDLVIDVAKSTEKLQFVDLAYKQVNLFQMELGRGQVRSKIISKKPKPLPSNPVPSPNLDRATRHVIELDGGAMSGRVSRNMMQAGVFWTINGMAMKEGDEYKSPILSLAYGKSYIFKIRNNTVFPHPIHMHGHTFRVLTLNNNKVKTPYFTDTISLNRSDEAEIAFVADNRGLWMFHCHILSHQVSGMMGVIEVS